RVTQCGAGLQRHKQEAETLRQQFEELKAAEQSQLRLMDETRSAIATQEEAHQQSQAEAAAAAEQQQRRLAELEATNAQLEGEAQKRAEDERRLNAQMEAVRNVEPEEISRLEGAQVIVAAMETTLQARGAE